MEISELSVKFVEAGLVTEGVKYKTPLELVPLSALFVESTNNGPLLNQTQSSSPINLDGINVNLVARRLEGTLNLTSKELSTVQQAFDRILSLHDKLRSENSVVTIKTGFSIEGK